MAYISADITTEKGNNGIKIDNIIKYYQFLADKVLTVGIHKDAGAENVKKMVWNEFGTDHIAKKDYVFRKNGKIYHVSKGDNLSIPARPVIRMYLYQKMKNEISVEYQLAINRVKKTRLSSPVDSADKTLQNLGQECVYMQREKMANGGFSQIDTKDKNTEKNTQFTENIKGFNHPYFETGELISKINYKVQRR